MTLKDKIKSLALNYRADVISYRRHLHAHPELSFEEYKTADFVAQQLESFGGIKVQRGVADTGVVGLIEGKNPGKKTIALRADMDALPIEEKNDVEYKSRHAGVMHACGHDVHTSSLLGTARILSACKDEFEGTVKLIFQPGEEKIPGGASLMIKAGVLENPRPANILGQHVMTLIPAGKVGFREGMYMASADELYITVKGKGGHAAMPDKNVDPILIASHIIIALQQIISRNCDPRIPAVLSFGNIIGKGATNVIPDEVKIEGTFRTLNEAWRKDAHTKMKKMA
jgi:amidohydrolase